MDALLEMRDSIYQSFGPFFGVVQMISIVVSVLMFFAVAWLLYRLNSLGFGPQKSREYKLPDHELTKKRTVKAWRVINDRVRAGDESNLKLAIIESDKILDEILKLSGYRGQTMAERLRQLTVAQLSNIEDVWEAHKFRNRIVHEPDFKVGREEAHHVLRTFKRAFQEFGLID